MRDLKLLEQQLGYVFNDIDLLKLALTHCSVGKQNNERLEFLGDAVLNLVIAKELFALYPQYSEGTLSRLRASLVNGNALFAVALEIGLNDFLNLGPGELKSSGIKKISILADALEAVIAAIFLDDDFSSVAKFIQTKFHDRLLNHTLPGILKDSKSSLQEYLQAKKLPLPEYVLLEMVGMDHERVFRVSCIINKLNLTAIGSGASRRKAEQSAAANVLRDLGL